MADIPEEPQIPPRLSADLRQLYGRGPTVPQSIDDAIMRTARDVIAARRRRMRLILGGSVVSAMAAAAAVLLIVMHPPQTDPNSRAAMVQLRGDVNGDGHVDILDALALQRLIDRPAATLDTAHYDLNGDGVVDRRDVESIAQAAVSMKGGPAQ